MIYAALLRGINVGGNNKIEMAKLKLLFEALGFSNIKTFIASGNVIFGTDKEDSDALSKRIESAIKKKFGTEVRVLLRDIKNVDKIIKALPDSWVNDANTKCDVIFLWESVDKKSILKELPFNPKIEEVKYIPGAVLWRIDRVNATKSRMFKIVGTKLYQEMTVRNCNTVRKIYTLMEEAEQKQTPP